MTNEEAIMQLKKCKSFHNGSYGEALNMAIKVLEQQSSYNSIKTELKPCEDCISRIKLLEHLENITMDTNPDHYESKDMWYQANGFNLCKVGIEIYIKNLPSVTPKLKVGKWIRRPDRASDIEYRCSECGKIQFADDTNELNYCCNCGSKMEVSE